MRGAGHDDVIDVIVPLVPRYAATLRTVTASFGADAGFSIDEIDDFRLAVTEAFSLLVAGHQGRRARASFTVDSGQALVRLSLESGLDIRVDADELAVAILRAVVDSYEIGKSSITMRKVATERATRE